MKALVAGTARRHLVYHGQAGSSGTGSSAAGQQPRQGTSAGSDGSGRSTNNSIGTGSTGSSTNIGTGRSAPLNTSGSASSRVDNLLNAIIHPIVPPIIPPTIHPSTTIQAPATHGRQERDILLFFRGDLGKNRQPQYSRGIRQKVLGLYKSQDWKAKYKMEISERHSVDGLPWSYGEMLARSKFCLVMPGGGGEV
jgi:hypothetical protein